MAYFSKTGNTKSVALQIQQATGGDMFEIATVTDYPDDYRGTVDIAKKEQEANARPAIKGKVADMAAYDAIYLGFPNWWGTMPMAVFTFLESYDFGGKTIIPFCTHEGSQMGRSESDIKRECPKAKVLAGLPIRGSSAKSSQTAVRNWIKELKY